MASCGKLSNEEVEQYDRQIRLWGLEAQKRLRSSRLLVIGLRGLAAEVCKDIVLAGVKSLTIIDTGLVTDEDDVGNRFLCLTEGKTRGDCAVARLQVLNPNVSVNSDDVSICDINEEYCTNYDLICTTSCPLDELVRLNEMCRKLNVKFFCGDTWGYYGYFFTDLQDHSFAIDVPRGTEVTIEVDSSNSPLTPAGIEGDKTSDNNEYMTVKKNISFCSLKDSLSFNWSTKTSRYFKRTPPTYFIIQVLQSFRDQTGRIPQVSSLEEDQLLLSQLCVQVTNRFNVPNTLINRDEIINHCFSELSPVCALVGGVLSQEIIKAISAKDQPFQNYFLYNGVQSTGIVETVT